MNQSMTSITDHSLDPDDDLSRISPELALVDPELARRLRERESVSASRPSARALRLLQPAESTAPPAVEWEGFVGKIPAIELVRVEDADQAPARRPDDTAASRAGRPLGPPDRSDSPSSPAAPRTIAPPRAQPPWPGRPAPAREASPVVPARAVEMTEPAAQPTALAEVSSSAPAGAIPAAVARRSQWWRRPGVQGFLAGGLLALLGVVALMMAIDDGSPEQAVTPVKPVVGKPPGTVPAPSESKAPGATTRPGTPTAKKAAPPAKATTPAGNRPRTAAKKAATGARSKSGAATPPRAAAEPRRFAWAPVEGAARYHVELFRGSERVLARETVRPTFELGSSWRYEGRVVRLTPGQYRWYVWPVTSGRRAAQAVVQAQLAIP